jgi:hypothetical protein
MPCRAVSSRSPPETGARRQHALRLDDDPRQLVVVPVDDGARRLEVVERRDEHVDATAWGMPAESGTAAGNWAGTGGLMPITA